MMSITATETINAVETTHDERLAPLNQLLTVSSIIMNQALTLLNNTITSNQQLAFTSSMIPGSTIGKHIRHAHEHFVLLLESVGAEQPMLLNYDVRKRDTPMETSVEKARETIQSLILRLEGMRNGAKVGLDDPLVLNAVTPDPQVLQSSFGRELWFAALHAVHHWSMVRVIAAEQSLPVEDSFGVAPSTLIHRGTDTALGRPKV